MHNHFPPGLHVAEKLGMSVGFCTNALNLQNFLTIFLQKHLFPPRRLHYRLSNSSQNCHNHKHFSCGVDQNGGGAAAAAATLSENTSLAASSTSPISDSGLNDDLMGYMLGKKKATEVAHSVWKHFVRKGDTVVDATCGNGLDTLAMLKMVKDDLGGGTVYGMDIQGDAVKRTSSLLDSSLNPTERKSVKLFTCCHSRMLEVLPKYSSVRLVAFNLGFLPGGDKSVVTKPYTTRLALEAAKEVLVGGGLISLVVYVGHPGGREEFDSVHGFACGLPSDDWCCSQIQVLNRPLAPILVFLFKR